MKHIFQSSHFHIHPSIKCMSFIITSIHLWYSFISLSICLSLESFSCKQCKKCTHQKLHFPMIKFHPIHQSKYNPNLHFNSSISSKSIDSCHQSIHLLFYHPACKYAQKMHPQKHISVSVHSLLSIHLSKIHLFKSIHYSFLIYPSVISHPACKHAQGMHKHKHIFLCSSHLSIPPSTIHVSIHQSIHYSFISLSICLSLPACKHARNAPTETHLPLIIPSIHPSIKPFIYHSINPSIIHSSVSSICLSHPACKHAGNASMETHIHFVCLPIYPSIYHFIHSFINPSIH